MYFKGLAIQGFKSFADKITLEFGDGISAIVGPNGSGKSNIADAIRWVLGEQSIKTLRGSKMEDLIFSGTANRKPLGFSEVSMTLDNSDNKIPIEYNEVTVTRRLFRSGESEYFINKSPCRLKDIQELFMDTGIGKDGYSVISQGKIDEILSTKSEDRRSIFEEASGIMKYKTRKLQAERKLEATRQNMLRINDIISELQIQLEPLREQSETAKKFLEMRESLKVLEVNLFIMNISRSKERLAEYEKQIDTVNGNMLEETAKLEKVKLDIRDKTNFISNFEEKLENARRQYYDIEGKLEKCESSIKINDEKINNLLAGIGRGDEEINENKLKIEELEAEFKKKQDKLTYLNGQFEKFSKKLSEYEAEMNKLLLTLNEAQRQIEEMSIVMDEKGELLSDKKLMLNSFELHLEAFEKRKKDIDSEIYKFKLEIDRTKMSKEDLDTSLYETRKKIKQLENSLSELADKKKSEEEALAEKRRIQSNAKSDIQVKQQRISILEEMENRMEGYSKSVKSLLTAGKRPGEPGHGICGAIAQLLKVDREYELAIEMSLGGSVQNLVAETEEDAKLAIEYLKKNRLGRATFLPITAVRPRSLEESILKRLSSRKGYIGTASSLISYEEKYSNIIANLLGQVVIVDNIDTGIRIAKEFSYKFRIVTLEGEVINTSGAMTGGSVESTGTGILGRGREIEALRTALEQSKRDYVQLTKDIDLLTNSLLRINPEIESQQSSLKENELIKIRDESHLAQIDDDIQKATARIELLEQEKVQLEKQKNEMYIDKEKCAEEANRLMLEIAEIKKQIAEKQEENKEGQSQRDALHQDITDYKVSVNSIVENTESVKELIKITLQQKEEIVNLVEKKKTSNVKSNELISMYKEKNEALKNEIKSYLDEKSGRTFEIDKINEDRKVLSEDIEQLNEQIEGCNSSIMLLKEDIGRIEVRKAKVESETESVQNRLWDEYELTYNNALEYHKDIGSMTAAQKNVDELKNQIRELGPVNVAAIDDYVKTKERYLFMSEQKTDMENAEEKLQRVIREMTSVMKKQFLQQFKIINTNFNLVFRELFDGGHAELILSDTEDVLECGIEIEVQPPGKKLQNMLLLSGGERALTAIALLFAILKLNPAPFCVLDEIEAALDDNNVYKFADYLKKYSKESQFIMITHRKGTMEISDTLYGVTMEERGISKVVSMKMEERDAS
ncbi:MAG: chromosome segregation protein SMC [Eubacteriales bacterium]|nr:chromosome segregation protein SMC [Eubacteriales bacterium]